MNFLKDVTVYLSGPIESCDDPNSWRAKISPELEKLGMVVWNPLVKPSWMLPVDGKRQRSWREVIKDGTDSLQISGIKLMNKQIRSVDRALAYSCNIMIVRISSKSFSVGTYEELVIAKEAGKPVFFLTDEPIPSMWLVDMFDAYDNTPFFISVSDLINHLRLIDNGITEVDRIAWIFKTYKGGSNV